VLSHLNLCDDDDDDDDDDIYIYIYIYIHIYICTCIDCLLWRTSLAHFAI
jgi:hypothetical protein